MDLANVPRSNCSTSPRTRDAAPIWPERPRRRTLANRCAHRSRRRSPRRRIHGFWAKATSGKVIRGFHRCGPNLAASRRRGSQTRNTGGEASAIYLIAMRTVILFLVFALVIFTQTKTVTKYGVTVQSGAIDSGLVKDYTAGSSLVVPASRVEKARFPVIDVHAHTSQSQVKSAADVEAWVRTMDAVGIQTTIVFTGATGADFDRQVELFSRYPNRFQLWCSLDTTDIESPDYPRRAVAEL